MSDGGVIRDLSPTDLPMCPNGVLHPIHQAHEAHVRTLNAFYEAAEKNDDDDMLPSVNASYYAAAYGDAGRMNLYHETVGFRYAGTNAVVTAWYLHCGICGLFLSATRGV